MAPRYGMLIRAAATKPRSGLRDKLKRDPEGSSPSDAGAIECPTAPSRPAPRTSIAAVRPHRQQYVTIVPGWLTRVALRKARWW